MVRDRERLARAFNPPPEYYDIRNTAAFAVTTAHRALQRLLELDRFELGLCEGRDLVVVEIARLGGLGTPKQVQESLGISASSLSSVLRRSVEVDYVCRERDPADRRSWRLSLTREGQTSALLGARLWRYADDVLASRLSSDVVWLGHFAREARSAWREARSRDGAEPAPGTAEPA